jgi:murein DD-endopeptidase MepM/ murein hydrolase activator NlpD
MKKNTNASLKVFNVVMALGIVCVILSSSSMPIVRAQRDISTQRLSTHIQASSQLSSYSYLEATSFRYPMDAGFKRYATFGVPASWCSPYHNGTDYYISPGANVYAIANGKVLINQWNAKGYGWYLYIEHTLPGNGPTVYSLYAHLSQQSPKKVNDPVTISEVIGKEGASGEGANNIPHLHFEIRRYPFNPNIDYCGNYSLQNLQERFFNPDVFIPIHDTPPLVTLNLGANLRNRSVIVELWRTSDLERLLEPDKSWKTTSDSNGNITNFALTDASIGDYYLLVKPQGWLRKQQRVNLVSGLNTVDFRSVFTQQACWDGSGSCPGDIDIVTGRDIRGDNIINIVDMGIVIDNYGLSNHNPLADLNEDGSVDIIDVGMMIDGYYKKGDGGLIMSSSATALSDTSTVSQLTLSVAPPGTSNNLRTSVAQVGDIVTLNLDYDTAAFSMAGVSAVINYDECVLQPLTDQMIPQVFSADSGLKSTPGTLEYRAHRLVGEQPVSGTGRVVSIPFRYIASVPSSTLVSLRFRHGSSYYSAMDQESLHQPILSAVNSISLYPTGEPQRPERSAQILSPAANTTINQNYILLQAQASDPCNGLHQVVFYVFYDAQWHEVGTDDDASDGWSVYWDASHVTDQVVKVKALAGDFAGNGVETVVNDNIVLDRQSPTAASVVFAPDVAIPGESVYISLALQDNLSGVNHADVYVDPSIDGSAPWPWNLVGGIDGTSGLISWHTTGYAPGSHQVMVLIEDNAGNQGVWPLLGTSLYTIKPSPNLLYNGGFEEGTPLHPTLWGHNAWQPSNSTFAWDSLQFHSGKRSIKISSNIANDAWWEQTIQVQRNSNYRLSGWIKTANVDQTQGDRGANLSILDDFISTIKLNGTNNWTYVSGDFNTGESTEITVAARLGMYGGDITGTAWFDDVKLELLSTPNCYSLTKSINPSGTGTLSAKPAPTCNNGTQYVYGTMVRLKVNPISGYSFLNWSGDISGSDTTVFMPMTSEMVVSANFIPTPPIPGIPTLLSPLDSVLINTLRPKLDWSDSTPIADHYHIQIATNSTFTAPVINESNVLTSDFTPTFDLDTGKRYYWRVKALNVIGGTDGWSTVRNFKTPLDRPVLKSPPNNEILINDRPEFDWEDVTGASKYVIQASTSSSFSTLLLNATINTSSYSMIEDLPQNQTLYWRVKAKTSVVSSKWSVKSSFKTGNPPSVPVSVSPTDNALVKDYTPLLDWSTSSLCQPPEFSTTHK